MRPAIWMSLLALACAGCAGYRLGPTGGQLAGAKSVQVNPFVNQTLEPRLTDPLTHALRKRLQQDGTYRLDTRGQGDVVVSGTIVDYDRDAVSFQPNDVTTPVDYLLTLRVRVTARDRLTGRVLVDRDVQGQTVVRVGPGSPATADWQNVSEQQALPLLAEEIARRTTALLVDGEW